MSRKNLLKLAGGGYAVCCHVPAGFQAFIDKRETIRELCTSVSADAAVLVLRLAECVLFERGTIEMDIKVIWEMPVEPGGV